MLGTGTGTCAGEKLEACPLLGRLIVIGSMRHPGRDIERGIWIIGSDASCAYRQYILCNSIRCSAQKRATTKRGHRSDSATRSLSASATNTHTPTSSKSRMYFDCTHTVYPLVPKRLWAVISRQCTYVDAKMYKSHAICYLRS